VKQRILMTDCLFDDVHAVSEGGVLYVDDGGDIIIENSNFTNCYSKCGGGMYIKGGVCYIYL
jgi:hypothetical protein